MPPYLSASEFLLIRPATVGVFWQLSTSSRGQVQAGKPGYMRTPSGVFEIFAVRAPERARERRQTIGKE
jgi:hypothetical protein